MIFQWCMVPHRARFINPVYWGWTFPPLRNGHGKPYNMHFFPFASLHVHVCKQFGRDRPSHRISRSHDGVGSIMAPTTCPCPNRKHCDCFFGRRMSSLIRTRLSSSLEDTVIPWSLAQISWDNSRQKETKILNQSAKCSLQLSCG